MARRRLAQTLAACVVLLAVLRLAGYAIGWDNGPDRWLFRHELEQYATPNRMAPNTAACFLLCGLALALLDVRCRRNIRPAEFLALSAAMIALLAIIGYTLQRRQLDRHQVVHPDGAEHGRGVRSAQRRNPLRAAVRRPDGDHQQHRQPAA